MTTNSNKPMIISCVDKDVPGEYLHPGWAGILHKKVVAKSNELLQPRGQKFDVSNPDHAHFYGTVLRYFSRQKEFFDSGLILNPETASLDKGLLILGGYGVGKSFLFNVLSELNDFTKRFGNSFSYISTNEVVELYDINGAKGITHLMRGQRYFDDAGTEERGSHYKQSEVMRVLLERRHDHFVKTGQKTFMTSNLSITEIGSRYGSRVESRIYELFTVIGVSAPDRRKTK